MSDEELTGPPSQADRRMADLLADSSLRRAGARRELREEASQESDDLLDRLNVLDYLDEVVGTASGAELPESLGDYRITGLLGRGGMGTVFEAFQESLEREVALKVLSPSLTSNPTMRRRFRIEARASASLHHQHIVPVFGFGESGGYLYFAMELVPGVSLDKLIASKSRQSQACWEPREAARRFAGVADALSHAHRRGILHRDVKPGNILTHPDGSLALADFGLSKMVNEGSMSLSRSGGFLGTLHYSAPEQAKGQKAGPEADLYSLGVTLFEVVTGELPLIGETTEAMLQSILHQDARRLRDVLPRAPKDLDAVLRKLLRKDPKERYRDGEALARDLQRIADGEPVQVRRQSPLVLAWRQVRKHPALSSAVLVASILLMLSTGLFISNERQRRESRYEERIQEAVRIAETGAGPVGGPSVWLQALTGVHVVEVDTELRFRQLLEEAQRLEPDDPLPSAMLTEYDRDPDPQVARELLAGSGLAAREILNRKVIGERLDGLTGRDQAERLHLFNVYLARAVASATAAVADPEEASRDLLRASFLRPGAFFPQVLAAVLEWQPESGTANLFAELDRRLTAAPAGARRVIGALLVAASGLDRSIEANMMVVEASYGERVEIYRRGMSLLGNRYPEQRSGDLGLLDRDLRIAAQKAMTGRAGVAEQAVQDGRRLLEQVASDSPLQRWAVVFAYLESGREGVTQGTDQVQRLTEGLQLLVTLAFEVRGSRQQSKLRELTDLLRELPQLRTLTDQDAAQLPRLAAMTQAQVRLLELADGAFEASDLEGAKQTVNTWIRLAPRQADAYLWRVRTWVLCHQSGGAENGRDPMGEAVIDAACACRYSPDPAAARRTVALILRDHDPALAQSFSLTAR